MLNELSITNFAIIDELHVSFDEGLNIISGETGAGKSILIGAVSLLLGDRATAEMIRTQADTATVEALFNIQSDTALQEKLSGMGFPAGEQLVIRRVISRTGKNRAQINGQMATLTNLAHISESLINICGQHEHQMILFAENHIDILDEFGGCLSARKAFEAVYFQYQQILDRMEKLENMRRQRADKIDLIQFQLKEIADLNPRLGEDAALVDEKKVLVNVQKLADYANRAYALLYAENRCVTDQLKEVLSQIKEIQKIDPSLTSFAFRVWKAVSSFCRKRRSHCVITAGRWFLILNGSRRLTNASMRSTGSNGNTADRLEAVLAKKQDMEEELQHVSNVEEELTNLTQEKDRIIGDLREKALALSGLRQRGGHFVERGSRCRNTRFEYAARLLLCSVPETLF